MIENRKSSKNKLANKIRAPIISVFNFKPILEYKKPPTNPPRKKEQIIKIRNLIVDFIFSLCGCASGKNNWESSIPKSVNKPVKCVVRTMVFEILVTKEFCNPIEKSNKQTIRFGYSILNRLLIIAIEIKIKLSIIVGTTKTFNFLLSLNFSIRKLDKKEPKRNEKIYRK